MANESRSHATAANRIARRFGTEYNKGQGVDVRTANIAIEVETIDTVSDGPRQLQGHRKPAYIAGSNRAAVDKAMVVTENTTIGVMDNQGNVVKPSSR